MSFQNMLRKSGLRATPKRVALLTVLKGSHEPRTAEELHAKVHSDLVTIYRNLKSLVAAGIVSETRFKDSTVRYELAHGHHHHVVCTRCGLVEELHGCNNAPLERQALHASRKFQRINEHALEFFGVCRSCA